MQTTTTRPATIDDQYARALARARKAGLRIVGQGRIKQDGTPFVAVSSSREPNHYYLVIVTKTRLICECAAGLRGKMCTHRAVVHSRLLQRWKEERERLEAAEAAETAKLHEALRELLECERIIDNALRTMRTTAGNAPTISQREAGALLGSSRSARVLTADVRGYRDGAADVSPKPYVNNRPISIWK